ncbi:MAG: hypothetical protein K2G45_10145 [Lachnospiraceae bacterium]|nr:hypothetical protein [Lachnospiraceae bacterium]
MNNLILPAIILSVVTIGILIFSVVKKKNSLATLLMCIVGMALLLLGIYLKDASMWSTFSIAFFILGTAFFVVAVAMILKKSTHSKADAGV